VSGKCDIDGGELYQRDDDKEEAIRRRWAIFEEQTRPIVEHYRKDDLVFEADATGEIEAIMGRITSKLDVLDKGRS
jgi:adenylate kinase